MLMKHGAPWKPAPENTLESLRHAFKTFDGVEFDIRLTADEQLVIHHDRTVSVPKEHLKGQPTWLEEWSLDDLTGLGFLGFDDFLDNKTCSQHGGTAVQWAVLKSNGRIQKAQSVEASSVANTTINTSRRS